MPTEAKAHGGEEVYFGDAGPYLTQAFALMLSTGNGDSVDYTVDLWNADSRRPVEGATITVTAQTPDERLGPITAQGFLNQYQAIFPVRRQGQWTMEVSIQGSEGTGAFQHTMTVDTGGERNWTWIIAGGLIAGLLATYLVAFIRTRKSRMAKQTITDTSNR